jgi:NADH:ubiquinone oxidoreductase subunit 2 (subunit N)
VGFKLLILQQVISSGMITVAIIAVVFAVISAYYYLQIIKSMYFEDSDKEILGLKNRQVGKKWVSDDCSYLCKGLKLQFFPRFSFIMKNSNI